MKKKKITLKKQNIKSKKNFTKKIGYKERVLK